MISITTRARPRAEPATTDELWRRFIEARATALRTLQIEDATAAGKAWAAFLASFTAAPSIVPEQSE